MRPESARAPKSRDELAGACAKGFHICWASGVSYFVWKLIEIYQYFDHSIQIKNFITF